MNLSAYVAVLGRNRTLFRCIFPQRYCIRSAVLPLRVGLIRAAKLHQCQISLVVSMSPTLNGSTALQRYECGNTVKTRNGISTRDCHIRKQGIPDPLSDLLNRLDNKSNHMHTNCIIMLSVSFFYQCIAFCIALPPFMYGIVML